MLREAAYLGVPAYSILRSAIGSVDRYLESIGRLRILSTARLLAYIHNNPVRAGLVDNPGDWSWSSYRATGGLEQAPPFLHVRFVRALFGSTSSYRDFCNRVAEQPGCASES